MQRQSLGEILRTTPVIDSHEHFDPSMEKALKGDIISEYVGQYLGHDLKSAGMDADTYDTLSDVDRPLEERFDLLQPWLSYVSCTGYGQCMKKSLFAICGENELTVENLGKAETAYREQIKGKALSILIKEKTPIRACIIDWMPLEWKFQDPLYLQAYDPLFLLIPENEKRFTKLEQFTGKKVRDFTGYLDACREVIRIKVRNQGVKVLKLPIAYHRELAFPVTAYHEAEQEYNRCSENILRFRGGLSAGLGFEQSKAFQNYVLHEILKVAEEYELTMQFHTGYIAGNFGNLPDSNPTGLIPLFKQYPGVKFDLFHMSYPYYKEAGAIAKMYPNVYLNMCWGHILSPNAAIDALTEWLHLVPYNKIIGFGADTNVALSILGHLEITYENIEKCLLGLMNDKICSEAEAVEIAKALLYDNAKKLYRIDG